MPKERVYELAKQYGLSNKVIIEKLATLGVAVKSHSSTLDDDQVKLLAGAMKSGGGEKEREPEKKAGGHEAGQQTAPEAVRREAAETRQQPGSMEVGPDTAPKQKPAGQTEPEAAIAQQQRPEGQTDKPEGAGAQRQRPAGQMTKPEGSTARQQKPAAQTAKPESTGTQQQRPAGQAPRPEGTGTQQQRPAGQQTRPQGAGTGQQRPAGQQTRPQGTGTGQQRPAGQQGRPQGTGMGQQRPAGQQGRQQGTGTGQQRPAGQQARPQGAGTGQQRPAGQQARPQGAGTGQQRPAGQQTRPQGAGTGQQRPAGQQARPQGAGTGQQRPAGQQSRPQGARPAGAGTNLQKPSARPGGGGKAQAAPGAKRGHKQEAKRNAKAEAEKEARQAAILETAPVAEAVVDDGIKTIRLGKAVVVKDLCEELGAPVADVIKSLMKVGIMVNVNQEIDYYTAANIAEAYDFITEEEEDEDLLKLAFAEDDEDDPDRVERPPVVVVMGHVDHGKTSLLDSIRDSKVQETEAGGITQHIGAYTVSIDNKPITFLDTPGHEAFTAMRMRGARVTDIAILVVAADDGVMPQTIEAINHAKAAGVDIIVAINKIDKPSANTDRVKQELVEYGLLSEDWGGETICVPVSAQTGEGIEHLLEMIILVAEMKELKANPNKNARGTVIEAMLDKGRGPVATILVQNGTLQVGDPIVAGKAFGKIRAMMDDKGRKAKTAGPSKPVEILGLSEVPQAGDAFYVANSEKQARHYAESVIAQGREELMKDTLGKVSLNDLFSQIQAGSVKELNIVVKADVQGSVEAVKNSLERLSNDEVRIRTIHGGVGAITESDVMLASASNAIIIGFNVRPEASAKSVAENEKVDLRLYRIIYSAIEDITAAMKGMLDPIFEEKVIGHAEIRQLFKASGVGTIAGSYVTDGKFTRASKVRIMRDGKVVFDGDLDTLKRFKDDVKEVNAGYECGLLFHKFNDIKEGDKVEAYVMEEIPR